ncbi:P-loop containing nucleoside triphosphate hydrolase protein [Dichotomopilus funicola]|uniref:P-loop containing nucleoside triphosphate hydrolase protein n=1 Tax=Dichotomopilus funicola TaxID=1934379 RepID=A0AAN6VAA9_9PEZI|nr:P-loop containing nucleoside triphosphate hydrolase protein [Dichotomopilus funicola]
MIRQGSLSPELAIGLAVIGFCSFPSVLALLAFPRKRALKKGTLYEDADGKATPASTESFSTTPAKSGIVALAVTGLLSSVLLAFFSWHTTRVASEILLLIVGAWTAVLLQAVTIASCRNSVQAYRLGLYAFLSSGVLAGLLLAQLAGISDHLLSRHPAAFSLWVVELTISVLLAFGSLSLSRRPDVFQDGELVDRMYTVSAFSRFNFSWPAALLSLAKQKKTLDLVDLPRPDHHTRSSALSADWKRHNFPHRLWLSLLLAHKKAFALQSVLALCTAILSFTPQWVILQLLRILENRPVGGGTFGFDVWIWVVWLALAITADSWVESYLLWLSSAELAIPVRAQLSSLIFEKAMRRRDVKSPVKSKTKGADEPETVAKEDDTEEANGGTQSTINLIGVDGQRVSNFCGYQHVFPGSLFKLVVSLAFLVSLLGWIPLLAGFSAMLAITPINIYVSKKYAAAQGRLMKVRDEKMGTVTEAVQGIRQIKFSALEPQWEKKIADVRHRELNAIWDMFMGNAALLACWVTSPILLSAISLAVYAVLSGSLLPSVTFVSLGIFKGLEATLTIIPELTTQLLDAWISVQRIEDYLNSPEVPAVLQDSNKVAFSNASIAWPSDDAKIEETDRFVLRDLNMSFPQGKLSVIAGKSGTGKSLILAAILGEVDVLGGEIYVPKAPSNRYDDRATKGDWIIPNAIAFVAQIPWMENGTIKDNIVFGLPYDNQRYKKTIDVCALKRDLEILPDGGNTEIGANGVNLSGGQKWRVMLARAIYSRAGILVFDDIFSAVDTHVGRQIFEQCLTGELATNRTRILVTHHASLCKDKTDYLVQLGEGSVLHAGVPLGLDEGNPLTAVNSDISGDEMDLGDPLTAVNSDISAAAEEGGLVGRHGGVKKAARKAARKFVEEESREQGAVQRHVYLTYLRDSGGWLYWTFILLLFIIAQGIFQGRSWWVKIWTGDNLEQPFDSSQTTASSREYGYSYAIAVQHTSIHSMSAPPVQTTHNSLKFYLSVYIALAILSSILGTLKYVFVYLGSIRASRNLFAKFSFVVLRTPIRWLDTVPVGRILNRFTADFNIIDSQLANSLSFGVDCFLGLFSIIAAGLFISGYVLVLAALFLLVCLYYTTYYLDAARPIKRLESTTKSPLFEQFSSALTGIATIRAFDKTQAYIEKMSRKIDDYSTATWHLVLLDRWMGWRMALIGSCFATFLSILILLTPGIDAALAGFALAFAIQFSTSVIWALRFYISVELDMNAAERIIEYTEVPTESLDGKSPPASWPTQGCIEVENLVVGYAPDLPPVLKGLTFSVGCNERVGVIGRTGAGKSSLTLALFRFLEARSGSVYIDGLDISKLKLHDLRSRLAIIPQDPTLFSGTIRSNLDPFSQHTDAALLDCLERVHLLTSSSETSGTATSTSSNTKQNNVFDSLSSPVSEGGLNLSQGQRQLLCLARAMVDRPRVMVLDEATSAVDMHTDRLIQRSIREEFANSTLMVIAHRLSTIADFDRILVLSDGQVAEFGTPRELWEKGGQDGSEKGIFRAMCEESGEKEKLESIVFGRRTE